MVVPATKHSWCSNHRGVPNLGCLVASIGMDPSSFRMPKRDPVTASYNSISTVQVLPRCLNNSRRKLVASSNGNLRLVKGGCGQGKRMSSDRSINFRFVIFLLGISSFLRQYNLLLLCSLDCRVLRQMLRHHGDRKWIEIAKSLPGIWTEEEDMKLIKAHQTYDNRWSAIIRWLPAGRRTPCIKNHRNPTKRSLNSKQPLRKKNSEQAAPGQPSHLEEYIFSC
uniref:Myb-like domain-containing protein n=1 Tax=Oryza punctata TaxID=4537 RepID=A0A0E0LIK2_ORYPU